MYNTRQSIITLTVPLSAFAHIASNSPCKNLFRDITVSYYCALCASMIIFKILSKGRHTDINSLRNEDASIWK